MSEYTTGFCSISEDILKDGAMMTVDEILEQLNSFQWISVEDQLPESGLHCLFVIPTTIYWICAGFVNYDECDFRDASIYDQYGDPVGYDGDCISHWMPLPEPPK